MLQSLGGDELNVAVALRLLGVSAHWISVLPTGPLGDAVMSACDHYKINFSGLRIPGADLGTFYVQPAARTVHYQRRSSAFALHDPAELDWPGLVGSGARRPWLHLTGITPLVSEAALKSWDAALSAATAAAVPTSLDLNHRKQLGSLDTLWAGVRPHVAALELLILSVGQLYELARLEAHEIGEIGDEAVGALADGEAARVEAARVEDAQLLALMGRLQRVWRCRRIVLCRKVRVAPSGVQRRWSVLTELVVEVAEGAGARAADGVPRIREYSSFETPVFHTPLEELGGGSAFAAGMLLGLHFYPREHADAPDDVASVLRRADLLAALCQQSAGDFSTVSATELATAEAAFKGGAAHLPPPDGVSTGATSARRADAPTDEASAAINATLARMLRPPHVVAILRTRCSASLAVARALELASLGVRAVEVTLDSADWQLVLARLRTALPADVAIGVGTVMDDDVASGALRRAAALGASFALSPIEPLGFLEECATLGLVAVPSALSSNELWAAHRRGARLIKYFHAAQGGGPATLRSMLSVRPLRALNLLPSGGVSPDNAAEWLHAGAAAVGMGANLVGADVGLPEGTREHEDARRRWEDDGRPRAAKLLAELARIQP